METADAADDHTVMVDPPPLGRVFSLMRRGLLGDCAPPGRVRLDAIARWLQDAAYSDLEDAGVEQAAYWVLRRTRIRVGQFPGFGERCEVRTFCSALGRMWAERRTTVASAEDGTPLAEAVALWVHLDPVRKLPTPITLGELEIYGESAAGRKVLARLRHPRPEHAQFESVWSFRHADCDVADHINNAVYWAALEEVLLADRPTSVALAEVDAEIEFRTPAQPGLKHVLVDGRHRWITDPAEGGEIYASIDLINARTTPGSN
jgi:acyl-ACP thioesterase